jgi:hypothetical protein
MFAATPMMAQNINLAPDVDFPIGGFGTSFVSTFGETFTAPDPTSVMQSFQFYLANDIDNGGNGGNLLFRGYVSEFDAANNSLSGPMLFQSAITAGNGSTAYAPYLFNTGFLVLDPAKTYIAFLSATGLAPADGSAMAANSIAGSDATNPRGSLFFSDNGDDFASLSQAGAFNAVGADAGFSAQFTVTPEPSEFVLLASGFGGLAGFVRVRRKGVARA